MAPALPELPGVRHERHALPTGVDVHMAVAGPAGASPLLLLHGWPQHWWCWRRVVPLLDGRFRLLMPDLRGLGWSGQPADADFRKDRLADDALALLDVLGIERAGLVGHDWGGFVGFLVALRAPERLHGLLALGILHPWQPPGRLARNLHRFAYQLPLATPFLGAELARRTPLVAEAHRLGWGDRSTFDADEVAPFTAAYRQPGCAEAGSRYYRDFLLREAPILAGRFAGTRLAVPTRLLYGTREPLGRALAEGLERHGDDARTELLPGCGHFVPEERPAEVAAAARELFGS
jgi:pimeloyl-ACP methyl ester carboxylesterase